MAAFEGAERLLHKFKGDGYLHGLGVLPQVGRAAAELGQRAVLVRDAFPGSEPFVNMIKESLSVAGVVLAGEVDGRGLMRRARISRASQTSWQPWLPMCWLPSAAGAQSTRSRRPMCCVLLAASWTRISALGW